MAETTIETLFRDFVNAGVPSSGAHKPVKADIRATLQGRVGYAISGREVVKTDDYTIVAGDAGYTVIFNKATAVTASLTAVATLAAAVESNTQFQVRLFNIGAGVLTIDPNASETINGDTTLVLRQYESATIWTDGSVWLADTGLYASAFMKTVLDDSTASAARTTLGAIGQSELHQVAALLTSDSAFNPTAGGVGWFTDYDCKSPRVIRLEQAEDNTGSLENGVIRTALVIQHADEDTEDYQTAAVRAIANGLRVVANGSYNGSGFDGQSKDIVGADFTAIARINGWDARGVSGVLANAIQKGSGIASNEFAAENSADANEQSTSMAAIQAILRPYKGAADGSHIYRGLYVENDGGYRATHGIQLASIDAGGSLDGSFEFGLYLYGSDVNSAAISMPRVGAGRGIIEYDSNYYSNYNAGSSRFDWVTNGNIRFSVGDYGIAAGAAVAGTSRLEVAAGTASIAQMNMAASATLSSPSNGDFWFDGTNLKIQIGGSTYNVDVTAA